MKLTIYGLIGALVLLLSFSVTSSFNYVDSSESGVILIGDTGKNNDGQLAVSRSIQDFCTRERCDFGMLSGDNVYPVGVSSPTDPILETMFDKYYNPLHFPFLVTLGNHDYGKLSNDWTRGAYQIEHGKKNPLFYLPDYYYTYETPEAVIAVIDTSRLMWRKETFNQADMVNAAYQVAIAKNKWFLVMGHHPYLSNGKHGNAGRYERLRFPYFVSGTNVKKFIDRYVCGKAHFYFSGHEHSLQVIDGNIRGCNTQMVVSGTGASSTKLFKRNKADFESTALGYFHFFMTPDTLRLRAVDSNAQVMFEKNYLK
jgi:hypothetical protein